MSYDTFNFDRDKILNYCNSLRKKELQIEYLQNVRIDYHQKRSADGIPSIDCDTQADTAKPEGGLDDDFIRWIYNEIQRLRLKREKYKRKTARLNEIEPETLYPRVTIAVLVARDPKTIQSWFNGICAGGRKKLILKSTKHGNEDRVYGKDMLKFLKDWERIKTKKP